MTAIDAETPLIVWGADGTPRSALFGDVYFSAQGGLAEARAVFLGGCGLPERWAGRARFTVAELGFGTGLNLAALLEAWRRGAPPGAHLSVFSVEAHPLARSEAARALAAFPEVAEVAALITARWPGRTRGFHRVDFPEVSATLDVAVLEAAPALRAWSGLADAWFLDGFAPARNPRMWRGEVLDLVARRSAPGARAATWSVAGEVRRGLAAAGFTTERRPGFGAKRQRLEARLPGEGPERPAPARAAPPRVAIVGAGIAGASLARAFAALGAQPTVWAAAPPGESASGGPAALVAPRLDAGLARPAALFAQAFARAQALYETVPGAVIARGAFQAETGPKDGGRFAAIAASDLFEPGALRLLDAGAASRRLGEAVPPGLAMEAALVIEPARILAAWLGAVRRGRVASVRPAGEAWVLLSESGAVMDEADAVLLAAGLGNAALAEGLGLTAVRGQASIAQGPTIASAALFGAYALPLRGGVLFGATHDRNDEDEAVRDADHRRNLAALAGGLPALAGRLAEAPLEGRTGVRAATADYLPLAGPAPGAPAGLHVLGGLGSRGFTLAPLLAEHLAATVLGAPSPLPSDLASLVDPARFARRARRRR